jgi:ABC-type nitrate/sulfonate/bicarbonate transport system permease component
LRYGSRRRIAYGAAGVLLLLAAWEFIGRSGVAGLTFPALSRVVVVYFDKRLAALLYRSAIATAGSALVGLLLGILLGSAAAFITHLVPSLRRGLDRLAVTLNAVPAIALGPIFIVMVSRDLTPILLATIPVFFLIYVAVTSGLRSTPTRLSEMMTTLGAAKLQRLVYVEFPYALPSFLSGLKISVTSAMIGAIVGEWFGAPTGLGIVILNTMQNFQIPLMWAAVLLTASISLAGYGIVSLAELFTVRRFT